MLKSSSSVLLRGCLGTVTKEPSDMGERRSITSSFFQTSGDEAERLL